MPFVCFFFCNASFESLSVRDLYLCGIFIGVGSLSVWDGFTLSRCSEHTAPHSQLVNPSKYACALIHLCPHLHFCREFRRGFVQGLTIAVAKRRCASVEPAAEFGVQVSGRQQWTQPVWWRCFRARCARRAQGRTHCCHQHPAGCGQPSTVHLSRLLSRYMSRGLHRISVTRGPESRPAQAMAY